MAELRDLHTQDEGPQTLVGNATRTYQPRLLRLATNENGVSMLEYALLASLIAVVAISSVSYLGFQSRDTLTAVAETMASAGVDKDLPPTPPAPPGP